MKPHELNFYKLQKTRFRFGNLGFLMIAVIIGAFFIWINLDYAKEVTIVNKPTAMIPLSPVPQFTITDKIQDGIELLKKSAPLKYETKNNKLTGELVRKQVTLAILDTNTSEIFEKRFWVNEQEIKNYKKTGAINLVPISSQDNSLERSDIRVNWWNSFNTDYEIPDKPELIVVANKYLFPSKYLSGLPEKSGSQYTDIIYAPYSKKIHLAEIIEAGKTYLEKNIDRAFAELEKAKVKSRSLSDVLITEGISKDFVRNIIVVEHLDPDGFRSASDGGKELSERVLAIIGANQENAYRYTGSPAGAFGLAQFIKSTYKNMVSKYPGANMIKDYNAGMANHVNAIKAMVLFFDSHKKDITGKITRQEIIKPLGITEEMLAAAYNGGPNKVVRSINKFGLAWITSQFNAPRTGRILKQETLNYIKKFWAVRNLNLFANILAN